MLDRSVNYLISAANKWLLNETNLRIVDFEHRQRTDMEGTGRPRKGCVEARVGIEPAYTALQAAA